MKYAAFRKVNSANGSVSVRIQVPVPKSRGLTLPFAFVYDLNGVHHPGSAGNGVMAWYSNTNFLSAGGWAYSMQLVSMVPRNLTKSYPPYRYTCNYVDCVFGDPSGGRHTLSLGLGLWLSLSVPADCRRAA